MNKSLRCSIKWALILCVTVTVAITAALFTVPSHPTRQEKFRDDAVAIRDFFNNAVGKEQLPKDADFSRLEERVKFALEHSPALKNANYMPGDFAPIIVMAGDQLAIRVRMTTNVTQN